jgi:predicted HAD superfamily hydrolase
MMTFPGLDPALAAQLSCHDLISIDVFDTVILRAVAQPVDVFSLVKLIVTASSEALPDSEMLDSFPSFRIQSERLARDIKQKANQSREVTLDEIYSALASLLPISPQAIELLKRTELDVETRVAYPNPMGKAVWAAALAAGKKVIYCSDMYLPSAFIAQLLQKCGCGRCDGLYVSCEHQRSKHEGTFFPYLAETYRVPLDRVLHIGDNEHSDYVMATQAGCAAIHLTQPRPGDRSIVVRDAGEEPFYAETVATMRDGLVNKSIVSGVVQEDDPCERIGYSCFGPLLTGFLLWLASMAQRNKPERILLFARDTYLIRKYLPRILGPTGTACDIQYLYVSRGALLLSSFTDFSLPRLWHLFSGKVRKPISYHLRKLGLVPELFAGVVRSAGYDSVEDLVKNGDLRMHTVLAKLHREILLESARRRPLVRRYLSQFVGGANRFMAVDVGWVGNMQASFLRILGPLPEDFELRGYYVGLHRSARDNDCPGHPMEGWLLHYGDPQGLEESIWWSGGVELVEFAMCGPHGTTLGYTVNAAGKVEPVLENEEWDAEGRALRSRLHKGAERFVEEYCDTYRDLPASLLASRNWASEFYRLVTAPTPVEAEVLGDIMHSDEAGGTQLRLPLAPRLDIADREGLAAALERCYWKAGLTVRNGLTGELNLKS